MLMRFGWVAVRGLALALACAFGFPPAAGAQRADALRSGVRHRIPAPLAPVASAMVPGVGQFIQDRDRSVIYVAVEALAWWKYSKDSRERSRQVNAYKDLARRVARAHFSPNGADADWTYYEMMRDYLESGNFSRSDLTLVPETDVTTFNGYTWHVITGTVDTIANKAEALQLYAQRAYGPELQWSWRNGQLQWDLFKRTTEKRNDAARSAQRDLAVIALNHLLSMVDAFASFRLAVQPQRGGGTGVGASFAW